MRKLGWMSMGIAALFFAVVLESCKDDDVPADLSISTLKSGDVDLNAATSPTNVAVGTPIVATFSTDVDASTATDANVTLVRTYDGSAVAKTIATSGSTVTITPSASLFEGDQYKVGFTAGLASTGGKSIAAMERTFGTVGIGLGTAPQSSSQTLYLQFSNGITDLTGNATKASEKVAYTADRFGHANSAANFRGATAAGNGDIVELSGSKFISASMTLSVWFYINQTDYVAPAGNKPLLGLGANNGYFIEIGDGAASPGWIKAATNHKNNPDPMAHVMGASWDVVDNTIAGGKISDVTKTGWHQLVLTNDASTYMKTIYFDGVKVKEINLFKGADQEWNLKDMTLNAVAGVDTKLGLGFFAGKTNTLDDWSNYTKASVGFKGYMDDLRIFSKALTASEVTTLYTAEKP